MSITFHCEHCDKKIEAADSAAGKWGKCPACHNKVYIPDLKVDEELKLAPIDNEEEKRKKQLMAETFKLTQNILNEKESPDENIETAASASKIGDKQLTEKIISYLRQMADGQLDQAEKTTNSIIPYHLNAKKILDKIAVGEIVVPELADIPKQVLSGLIRTLRGKIS